MKRDILATDTKSIKSGGQLIISFSTSSRIFTLSWISRSCQSRNLFQDQSFLATIAVSNILHTETSEILWQWDMCWKRQQDIWTNLTKKISNKDIRIYSISWKSKSRVWLLSSVSHPKLKCGTTWINLILLCETYICWYDVLTWFSVVWEFIQKL